MIIPRPLSHSTDYYSTVDGYVLTPISVQQLGIRPELNPLLMPPSGRGGHDFLKWNMLYPAIECQRSSDPAQHPWSRGRHAPATWPRVTSLWLVSRGIPGPLEVNAADKELGVTCGDVISEFSKYYMTGGLTQQQHGAAPTERQRVLHHTCYHNRSTGDGARQGLGPDTLFGGCETTDWLADMLCGRPFPCVFELKMMREHSMTERELKDQKLKMAAAEEQAKEQQAVNQKQEEQKQEEKQEAEQPSVGQQPVARPQAEQNPVEQKPAAQASSAQALTGRGSASLKGIDGTWVCCTGGRAWTC